MNEFLNPKSMVTPGVAGGMIMFLVNGLALPFPELPMRYVALALSFLIGTVVFSYAGLKLIARGAYWVVNSLLIFVVGFGTANLGHQAASDLPAVDPAAAHARVLLPQELDLLGALLPSAQAQPKPATPVVAPKPSAEAVEIAKLKSDLETLRRQNEQLQKDRSRAGQPEKQQFFKKW